MATDNSATIVQFHQPKRPMTPAERARNYRLRKKAKSDQIQDGPAVRQDSTTGGVRDLTVLPRGSGPACRPSVTARPVTSRVTPSRRSLASISLATAAFGLAGVGVTMNGWFAHSLGSSDIAGWLFLAIGVAADLVALAIPACAARLWQTRRRGSAMAGWTAWVLTFAFAVTAGIGFASVNIADVTASRASRVTPAVTAAQTALADAMAARDRECKGGVGKFCREREAAVNDRRQALDAATKAVGQTADPQTEAAIKIVAWLSVGTIKPVENDFSMLRLILLALLPQMGGVLLMVSRSSCPSASQIPARRSRSSALRSATRSKHRSRWLPMQPACS